MGGGIVDNRNGAQAMTRQYAKCKYLFLLLLPALVWYTIFSYGPLYGVQLAFKEFRILQGIGGSPWIGFHYFEMMLNGSQDFFQIVRNTLVLSFYHIVFGFPAPIVLALLFNELRLQWFKKLAQAISYLPHFFSWVVLSGFLITVLSPSTGVVNQLLELVHLKPIYFIGDPHYFRFTLVVSGIWKEVGWGAIIYLAALASTDPQLYEAAVIDGAGRWKQLLHITLPSLIPVVSIMLIFRIGGILDAGFDQVLNLYTPATYQVADILDTYVYRLGLEQMQFGFATAVGLFKNVIAFALVLLANYAVRKSGEEGLL
ncbi:MAG: sugar ABC transporter permease [Paenibacillaceae bacterium]|nr:sugar ABC transporter permease [Paenibacillaceae bacterium]